MQTSKTCCGGNCSEPFFGQLQLAKEESERLIKDAMPQILEGLGISVKENNTWTCPLCGGHAYQRFGIEYIRHFMCKGCSVLFGNPKKFNKAKVNNNGK